MNTYDNKLSCKQREYVNDFMNNKVNVISIFVVDNHLIIFYSIHANLTTTVSILKSIKLLNSNLNRGNLKASLLTGPRCVVPIVDSWWMPVSC